MTSSFQRTLCLGAAGPVRAATRLRARPVLSSALARRCAAPALGAGEVAARGRALGGGGREDPVLLAACPSQAVAIWGSMFI